MDNFIPISRNIKNHWVFKNSAYIHIWLEILINARYSNEPMTDIYKGTKYTINRGEFIFSRKTYAARLRISESIIRRCVDYMVEDAMIEKVTSLGRNKPTLYKVCNYDAYNRHPNGPTETLMNKGILRGVNPLKAHSKPTENPLETHSGPLKNIDNIDIKNNKKDIDDFFEQIWQLYPSKKGKASISDKKKKELYAHGYETIKMCIERYIKYVNANDWLKYKNGSTFFNSGYVDYLDDNYQTEAISKKETAEDRLAKRKALRQARGG